MNDMQQANEYIDQNQPLYDEVERCRDWLQAALDVGHNTHDVEDVEDLLVSGRCQLWSAHDGCVITEVIEYPNYRNLHIWLCGGNLERIMDMLPDIENFARYIDAKNVTNCGRHGWLKMLEPHGYSKGLLSLSKSITIAVKQTEGV